MCARGSGGLCWLAPLTVCAHVATGEVYIFDEVSIPPPRALHGVYLFYVFSAEDAPTSNSIAPFVEYRNFKGALVNDTDTMEEQSIQVSIMPFRDFDKRITKNEFCSDGKRLLMNMPPGIEKWSDVAVYEHTVPFPSGATPPQPHGGPYNVSVTAVYILLISNCGSMGNGTISGEVHVKNGYGYLPGNEFHKMPLYGGLTLVYLGLTSFWFAFSMRWRSQLLNIHWCIFAVVVLSFLEAFLYWLMLMSWNTEGLRNDFLFPATLMASISKSAFAYMLVLVASLGWGIILPTLEDSTIMNVQVVFAINMMLGFVRDLMLSFKFSHHLSFTVVLLCSSPAAVLDFCIFWRIFTDLFNLIASLKLHKQVEKLALFEKFSTILMIATAIAAVSTVAQLFLLPQSLSTWTVSRSVPGWHYQWFFVDGVTHLIFLFVLVAMMYLWAPHENSARYVHSQQIGLEDSGEEGELIGKAEMRDLGEDDDDSDNFRFSNDSLQ